MGDVADQIARLAWKEMKDNPEESAASIMARRIRLMVEDVELDITDYPPGDPRHETAKAALARALREPGAEPFDPMKKVDAAKLPREPGADTGAAGGVRRNDGTQDAHRPPVSVSGEPGAEPRDAHHEWNETVDRELYRRKHAEPQAEPSEKETC